MEKSVRKITREAHYTWLGSYIGKVVVVIKTKKDVILCFDGAKYSDCKGYLKCLSKPLKRIPLINTKEEWWWKKSFGKWSEQSYVQSWKKENRMRMNAAK